MELYRYEPLKRAENGLGEIRLARLRSGAAQDEVHVVIKNFSIENIAFSGERDRNKMIWHALSYTWGNPDDTEAIMIETNGVFEGESRSVVSSQSLTVTRNLTEVLRELRSTDEDKTLWVDAICINQATDATALEERAWQVKLMHHVYSKAFGVIIWLGAEANDSNYAFQLLEDLGSSITVDWSTSTISTPTGELPRSMIIWRSQPHGHPVREFNAIRALIERPWFTRMWIRQEVALADEKNTVVVCGTKWISLNNFRKGLYCLSIMREDLRCNGALSIFERQYLDDVNLMIRARVSQCGDKRDKVYGNLGIMNSTNASGVAALINVDYGSFNTIERTYFDFFRQYYERYRTLRLLSEAGLCQGSAIRPTWLPDWRSSPPGLDLSMECATSHFAMAECVFHDEGTLQVFGCIASEILETYTLEPPGSSQSLTDEYKELSSVLSKQVSTTPPETSIERLTRALCCPLNNLLINMDTVRRYRETIRSYVRYLLEVPTNAEIDLALPETILKDDNATWALHRCVTSLKAEKLPFIFCKDGFVGIGCQEAQAGDVVAAILGSRALILLRPTGIDKYQVVGPCSVHDLNWGEALLGPLPKDILVVPHLEPSRGVYVPYYCNTKTGKGSMWDPRIAWAEELEPHPPMLDFLIVPAPPGEPLRIRPDSEYLKRHGVALKDILLV